MPMTWPSLWPRLGCRAAHLARGGWLVCTSSSLICSVLIMPHQALATLCVSEWGLIRMMKTPIPPWILKSITAEIREWIVLCKWDNGAELYVICWVDTCMPAYPINQSNDDRMHKNIMQIHAKSFNSCSNIRVSKIRDMQICGNI